MSIGKASPTKIHFQFRWCPGIRGGTAKATSVSPTPDPKATLAAARIGAIEPSATEVMATAAGAAVLITLTSDGAIRLKTRTWKIGPDPRLPSPRSQAPRPTRPVARRPSPRQRPSESDSAASLIGLGVAALFGPVRFWEFQSTSQQWTLGS